MTVPTMPARPPFPAAQESEELPTALGSEGYTFKPCPRYHQTQCITGHER